MLLFGNFVYSAIFYYATPSTIMAKGPRMEWRTSQGNNSNSFTTVVMFILLALLFLVNLAVTAVIYASPIILFIGLLYYQLRAIPLPNLSTDEAAELRSAEEEQGEVAGQLWEVEDEARRFDVKVNSDKTYHRGSKRGVRLNARVEEIDQQWSSRQETVAEIINRVQTRISARGRRFAFRWAVVAYCAILFSLILIRPDWLERVSTFADQHVLARISDTDLAAYGAALIAGISAIVVLGLTYGLRRGSLRAMTRADMRRLKELESWVPQAEEWPTDGENANGGSEGDDIDDVSDGNQEGGRTCYEVLGVPPTATRAEIEAAYRIKIKATHPDRVMGLDQEIQALADQKTKCLNAAHGEALRRL